MAWQRPNTTAHAARTGLQWHAQQLTQSSSSALSSIYSSIRRQQGLFSTSSSPKKLEITAAPPIDLGKLARSPARILPRSPAYFSGSPKFVDHSLSIERLLAKYAQLPTIPGHEAPRMAWLKLVQFRNFVEEPVPTAKYKRFIKVLQRLNRIDPNLRPQEVSTALEKFLRPGNPYQAKPAPLEVDQIGRARGAGKRKESSAQVWLVEGEGEVMINGKSLAQAFPRLHDRESAMWALRATQRLDKYNAFVLVRGGGVTGQAEAITLATARALLVHEPDLKPALRRAGCITVDPRRVERKKPGHVKARKMPTWVKR